MTAPSFQHWRGGEILNNPHPPFPGRYIPAYIDKSGVAVGRTYQATISYGETVVQEAGMAFTTGSIGFLSLAISGEMFT